MLAYAAFAERTHNYEVDVVGAEGGDPRRLTDGWAATWSPNGTRLAVVRNLNLPAPIDLVDLQGRTLARVTETAATGRVSWSRFGRIAFAEYVSVGREPAVTLPALVLADVNGGRRTLLGPLRRPAVGDPDLSADGRSILVTMWDDGGDRELYRRDREGGRLRQLTDNVLLDDENPAASPDGRQLAFVRGGVGEGVAPCTS